MEAMFELPEQDLKKLSFCKTDKESLQQWVEQLPVADMSASTRLLYTAIQEVGRLNIPASVRMDMIELLRPAIHFACEGLKKSYLNQAILLPDQPRKIANLSQALRKHLAIASLLVVKQCREKMNALLMKPSALLNKAIYYSLSEYQEILICNYLLYRPVSDGFWLQTHALFNLSAHYKLEQKPLKLSTEKSAISVENIYQQLLLWGCIKANQLRQDDIRELQSYMQQWAKLIYLETTSESHVNSLIVDPDSDMPPIYQKFHQQALTDRCTSLNTADLIAELQPLADPLTQNKSKLSPNLVSHLVLAWSVFTDRTFMRLEANSDLAICIGLSTAHYFLGDQKPFDTLVYGSAGAPNQMRVKTGNTQAKTGDSNFTQTTEKSLDAWDQSLYGKKTTSTTTSSTTVTMESINFHMRSGGKSRMTTSGNDKEKYQNYDVKVLNMSPGGYCIEWDANAPNSIKAGEIIAVKGEHHNNWHIGAIRWVKQHAQKGLQIGVELISPSASPYGAKFVALSGQDKTDYLRVLVLPEIKPAGQEASIITPSLSFKAGQHIHLMLNGQEETILLRELKTSTGSYSQFTYDTIKPLAEGKTFATIEDSANTKPANDIDSVWELL